MRILGIKNNNLRIKKTNKKTNACAHEGLARIRRPIAAARKCAVRAAFPADKASSADNSLSGQLSSRQLRTTMMSVFSQKLARSLAAILGLVVAAPSVAVAQMAPVGGDHYAARESETGFAGAVNWAEGTARRYRFICRARVAG